MWGWSEEGVAEKHVEQLNLDLSDRRLRLTLDLARRLIGVPRHSSQHPGGFVLTHDRLDDLVPIEPAAMADRQIIEWDSHFSEKLVEGMVSRGYPRDFAERTFKQLEGFGSYGFPESHAASFAKIAYASSWVKHHHPDVFCAALMNAQPMGFYAKLK